ncbi:MAG: Lrp/AsnC family transcriptional regulator [Candidatus Hodarchaeota archaeon]
MSLTDKDAVILCHLIQNPEISLVEIGKRVELSHVSVRSRINKMKSQNIMEKRVLLNPEILDLKITFLFIKSENEEKKKNLLSTFKQCPRVFFLNTMIDYYDICVGVVAEDRAILELLRSNDYCLLRFPGIIESEIKYQENLLKPLFLPILLPLCNSNTSVAPCNETCNSCDKYRHHICVGCPNVKEYRGMLRIQVEF